MDQAETVPGLTVVSEPTLNHRESWGPAWWVWTAGQAGVMGLYAARVPLSGGYPLPVEATADLGLAVTQLVLACLLGPALLGSAGRALRAAAPAVTFGVLATALAGRPWDGALRVAWVELAWLAAIGMVGGETPRLLLTLMTIAGPLLWYVAIEYGGRSLPPGAWPALACPVLGLASTRLHGDVFRSSLAPGLLLIVSISTRLCVRRPVA